MLKCPNLKINKNILLIISILTIQLGFSCWGTRPLAMGGAFTGLADDTNAVYWNPAGLAYLKKTGFASHFLTDQDKNLSNYDQYLALNTKLNAQEGLGFAYVKNTDILIDNFPMQVIDQFGNVLEIFDYSLEKSETYLQAGWGKMIQKDLAIGFSIKSINYSMAEKFDSIYFMPSDDSATLSDMDFGLTYDYGEDFGLRKKFRFGILYQNFLENKTEFKSAGAVLKNKANLRPGLSILLQPGSILAFEYYAANLEETDIGDTAKSLRVGVEQAWQNNFFLRFGVYGLNKSNSNPSRAETYGLGCKVGGFNIDYTIMHWTATDDNTHFIGINSPLDLDYSTTPVPNAPNVPTIPAPKPEIVPAPMTEITATKDMPQETTTANPETSFSVVLEPEAFFAGGYLNLKVISTSADIEKISAVFENQEKSALQKQTGNIWTTKYLLPADLAPGTHYLKIYALKTDKTILSKKIAFEVIF